MGVWNPGSKDSMLCSMLCGSTQERGSLQKCNSGLATAARASICWTDCPGFAKAAFVVTQIASQSRFPNTKTSYLGLLRAAVCLSSSHPEDLVCQVLSRLSYAKALWFLQTSNSDNNPWLKQKVAITNFKQRAVQSLGARHSRFQNSAAMALWKSLASTHRFRRHFHPDI